MPQRIPSPGCAEFVLNFQYNGEYCINRLHYFSGVPWTADYLRGMAEVLWDWWVANIAPSCPNTVILTSIVGTDLSTSDGNQVTYVDPILAVGLQLSPALPNNVTLVVSWITETRGRSSRGRTYHIGIREDVVVQNTVDSGWRATLENGYRKLIDDPGIVELSQFVVLSEVSNGAPRPAGVTYEITDVKIDNTLDSQRRRLPGH